MKKLETQLAETISTWMSSDEVKAIVDQTRAAKDEDTGTFRMVITTENLDRYQEVISMDGWELDHYLSNPVVLWGHDHYTPPVAVTDRLFKEDGKLIAEGRFAPTEMGQMLRKLYDLGFQRASSVGFIEKERQGNLITKAELIEWSFVSVPANPYALGLAYEKGMSIDELVTKGFFNLKHTEEVKETDEETEDEEVTETTTDEEVVEEAATEPETKAFNTKAITPIVEQLRAALGALEALSNEEPERTEDEDGSDDAGDAAMREFVAAKRTMQALDTTIGEVLAELRKSSPRA